MSFIPDQNAKRNLKDTRSNSDYFFKSHLNLKNMSKDWGIHIHCKRHVRYAGRHDIAYDKMELNQYLALILGGNR